jgi:hypothetical protein
MTIERQKWLPWSMLISPQGSRLLKRHRRQWRGLLAVLQFVREQSQDDFLFDGDEGKTTSFSMATKRAHALSASIEHAVLGMLPHR